MTFFREKRKGISRVSYEGSRYQFTVLSLNYCFIVIAFAYGKDLSSLTYLGLAGIIDPPRRGVSEAIQVLKESGVQVKMITGDARDTAVAVAKSIGLDVGQQRNVISGEQLESMDVYELRRVINEVYYYYVLSFYGNRLYLDVTNKKL